MNVSQLAAALGISRPMVRKYLKRGMPSDSEKSARAWLAENSSGRFAKEDSSDGSTPTGTQVEPSAAAEPTASMPGALTGLSQAELTKRLTAARIRLTERDAAVKALQERQAKMDADLRDGKLLRAEEENRKGFERAVALRNKLLALPAEWAVQLAAITDPALVADFTRKRIKAALIEYCAAYGVTAESE